MKEARQIKVMFDTIARRYDFLNHLLSLCQDYYWRRALVKELLPLKKDRVICDLATGTGDVAVLLAKYDFRVIGLDLSLDMLKFSKKKLYKKHFFAINGSAYSFPFKDESFDAITCSFGIRNMHATEIALKEIFRILKTKGKVVFLEFALPNKFFLPLYKMYMKFVPHIAKIFSNREAYEYLWDSINKFPPPDKFADLLINAGFTNITQRPLSFGTVYLHKAFKF